MIEIDYLRECVSYNPETGDLIWLNRPISHFSSVRACNAFNAKNAGKPAFSHFNEHGYRCGRFMGRNYKSHRIAWALATGKMPEPHEQIDHINGDRADNRLCNLRIVDREGNARNQKLHSRNKTGYCGVFYDKRRKRYLASIRVNGRSIHLGRFEKIEDAIAARKAADVEYGFHYNHGAAR